MTSPDHAIEMLAQGMHKRYTSLPTSWDTLLSESRDTWRILAQYALHEVPRYLVDPQSKDGLVISTLYSATSYQPIVQIDLGQSLSVLQLPAKDIRDFALSLIEAAEASMSDAFLIEFFKRFHLEDEQLWSVIREFRDWRGARIPPRPSQDPTNVP